MPAPKRSKGRAASKAPALPLLATTDAILESISDGVFTVDRDWRITSFNRAAEAVTGVSRAEAIGRPCAEVFKASMCEAECALRKTLSTGKPIVNRSAFIVNAAGRRIPISVSTAMLKNAAGRVVGGAETFRDLSLVEELRKELSGRFEIGDLVSRSPSMRKLFDILPQLAASESTVLIQGETGTGKELAARAIHALSPRSKRPFVAINCGALPDTLLESELFGYKAGAFTGANRDKPGLIARAEGGTLLLDEIGEVSPALQVRLLRVLQDRTYEPLGASASLKADVRVIAATHRDLDDLVKKGAFRQDLFYRINVVRVEIPPLRRRKEDIPLLVDHFIARFNRLQGRTVPGLAPDAMSLLLAHDYPGNVRELENLVEHAFVLCGSGRIETRHLPAEFTGSPAAGTPPRPIRLREGLKAAEARLILDALQRNRNNRLAAARELGLHKSTFFRRIKALGLDLPDEDGRTGSPGR
jgi:PAS domain S-box-containing protein